MGQAKLRGTFEQRRNEAVQLKIDREQEERQARKDWWNALTEEQKEQYIKEQEKKTKAQLQVAQMLGFVMASMRH